MHGVGVHRWPNGTCREGRWGQGERLEWTSGESFGLFGPYQRKRALAAKAKEKERMERKVKGNAEGEANPNSKPTSKGATLAGGSRVTSARR
eukprot:CAMPEP_0172595034 /NCGR_PEP_ID=MMETSP1068-20121228/14557_1 /TAXON_ID=35684 /ORGANISM="Pseudopedinella elastica, Strain CCMP716" /LENGTH=91 /DNA_ID=CAMNT_0013393371 /DNA_START=296 /DNA_END=571 /DNA_ORIENTATION=-